MDLPTVAKESLKLLIALATNKDFELATMDIRATIGFCEGNKRRYSRSVDCFQGWERQVQVYQMGGREVWGYSESLYKGLCPEFEWDSTDSEGL